MRLLCAHIGMTITFRLVWALVAALFGLKLFGVINWWWLWILLPLWGPVALWVTVVVVLFVIVF